MKTQLLRIGSMALLMIAAVAGHQTAQAQSNVYSAPISDAFTFSVYPDFNYGSLGTLEVYRSAQNDLMWSFLRFDLASLSMPTGAIITSAELRMYLSSSSGTGPFPVNLYSVNQSWSESTINWSSQPSPDTPVTSANVPAGTDVWVTWDVTTLAQQWWSGVYPNQGLVLTPGGNNAMQLFFASREDATNSPRLMITYTPPTNCLSIYCPTNLTAYLCGSNCVTVPFVVTGSNACNPQDFSVTTDLPTNYCFSQGTTWVHATAFGSGQSNQCSFSVTVLSDCPPSSPPPSLSASRLGPCLIQLRWTDPATNYLLQFTTNMAPPIHWQEVTEPVTWLSNFCSVTVSNACQGTREFRLRVAGLPVYTVVGPAVTGSQFNALAGKLNLPAAAYDTNGFVLFTDPDLFVKIPTDVAGFVNTNNEENTQVLLERLAFGQITQLPVLSDSNALQLAQDALASAGLIPAAPQNATSEVVHSQFRVADTNGGVVCDVPIDTKVRLNVNLRGIPLVGPGAKAAITFDGLGNVTHINYSLRRLQPGPIMTLLPQSAADQIAMNTYLASFANKPGKISYDSKLVYYAPPGEKNAAQTLIPHYAYSASFTASNGAAPILLRSVLIPAIASSNLVPAVSLSTSYNNGLVGGQATATGGHPPYTYLWNSSSAVLVASNSSPSIYYQPQTRSVERLSLLVVDANGLTASASADIPANIQQGPSKSSSTSGGGIGPKIVGVNDVGTEWIGTTAGLDGSSANAGGFVSRFSSAGGTTVRFNWGDHDAFERDFKDPALGGDDANWVDNVDAVFYTGHAGGEGWVFTSAVGDDFLHYTEARYGQTDLEWLAIAACGPLEHGPYPDDWTFRWPRVFKGLHLLCGYDNESFDNSDEGRKWADYMLRGNTVAQAWLQTGIEVQWGAALRVGVLGVADETGACNVNDHYWGKGTVGPDILRVIYSWGYSVPVD
jgi:hypothetical protein